jgi:hypothetical protein
MGRLIKLLLLPTLILLAWTPPLARSQSMEEYRVKAGFIYNFAKFVQWPQGTFASDAAPLVFCILGDDPFGTAIDSIDGKPVGSRKLVIRQIKKVEDRGTCQVLYIAPSEKDRLTTILKALSGLSILTISDMEHFAELGGMIGLIRVDNNIRFEVGMGAVRGAKLEISSKLLKLADKVRDE